MRLRVLSHVARSRNQVVWVASQGRQIGDLLRRHNLRKRLRLSVDRSGLARSGHFHRGRGSRDIQLCRDFVSRSDEDLDLTAVFLEAGVLDRQGVGRRRQVGDGVFASRSGGRAARQARGCRNHGDRRARHNCIAGVGNRARDQRRSPPGQIARPCRVTGRRVRRPFSELYFSLFIAPHCKIVQKDVD